MVQSVLGSLQDRLEPAVMALGYELLCLELVGSGNDSILRLYIDAENGVGLEDCETVSREVSALLDVEDPIDTAYRLEVSSPGFDRPLVKAEHFRSYLGQETKLKLRLPQDGRRNFRGRIVACEDERLTLEVDNQTVELALADIERARLVPTFD